MLTALKTCVNSTAAGVPKENSCAATRKVASALKYSGRVFLLRPPPSAPQLTYISQQRARRGQDDLFLCLPFATPFGTSKLCANGNTA